MSTISVELPDSLRQFAEEVAQRENVTLSQLISSALTDKVSALMSDDYLEMRAKRGSIDRFRELMLKVPNVPPPDYDAL